MAEFRVEGITSTGKTVAGNLTAESLKVAKKKSEQLAREKQFKVTRVLERVNFIYRVQRGTEKPIDGEQRAYSKEEVKQALERMGYRVVYVRKKLFGGRTRKAPSRMAPAPKFLAIPALNSA